MAGFGFDASVESIYAAPTAVGSGDGSSPSNAMALTTAAGLSKFGADCWYRGALTVTSTITFGWGRSGARGSRLIGYETTAGDLLSMDDRSRFPVLTGSGLPNGAYMVTASGDRAMVANLACNHNNQINSGVATTNNGLTTRIWTYNHALVPGPGNNDIAFSASNSGSVVECVTDGGFLYATGYGVTGLVARCGIASVLHVRAGGALIDCVGHSINNNTAGSAVGNVVSGNASVDFSVGQAAVFASNLAGGSISVRNLHAVVSDNAATSYINSTGTLATNAFDRNETLSASPFVNGAAGDFRLSAIGRISAAAIRSMVRAINTPLPTGWLRDDADTLAHYAAQLRKNKTNFKIGK